MTKKLLFPILAAIFLTGCESLSIIRGSLIIKDPTKHLTEQQNSVFNPPSSHKKNSLKDIKNHNDKKSYGLKILADQVLGKDHGCSEIEIPDSTTFETGKKVSQPKYYEGKDEVGEYYEWGYYEEGKNIRIPPLTPEMAASGTMKEIMRSQCAADGDLTIGFLDIKEFISALQKEYVRAFTDTSIQKLTDPKDGLVFSNVLLTYAKAYYKGEFVLRDGTVLAKPSTDIGFNKDGQFIVSTNNDTLTGLTTVFLEALSEFAFPTPIFVKETMTPTYEKYYREIKKIPDEKQNGEIKKTAKASVDSKPTNSVKDPCDPTKLQEATGGKHKLHQALNENQKQDKKNETVEPILCELFYKRTDVIVINYLSTSNRKPTVQTLNDPFFDTNEPLVKEGSKGISPTEFNAIRFISSNVADGSKMVLGTTLRTVGGVGFSLGAFGKVSVGDNDALAKIVETSIEVLSRRLLEFWLYQLLNDNEDEEQLLWHFGDPLPKG